MVGSAVGIEACDKPVSDIASDALEGERFDGSDSLVESVRNLVASVDEERDLSLERLIVCLQKFSQLVGPSGVKAARKDGECVG